MRLGKKTQLDHTCGEEAAEEEILFLCARCLAPDLTSRNFPRAKQEPRNVFMFSTTHIFLRTFDTYLGNAGPDQA